MMWFEGASVQAEGSRACGAMRGAGGKLIACAGFLAAAAMLALAMLSPSLAVAAKNIDLSVGDVQDPETGVQVTLPEYDLVLDDEAVYMEGPLATIEVAHDLAESYRLALYWPDGETLVEGVEFELNEETGNYEAAVDLFAVPEFFIAQVREVPSDDPEVEEPIIKFVQWLAAYGCEFPDKLDLDVREIEADPEPMPVYSGSAYYGAMGGAYGASVMSGSSALMDGEDPAALEDPQAPQLPVVFELEALTFVADHVSPVIEFVTSEEVQGALDGVTYFQPGTTVAVVVADNTFDAAKSVVYVDGEPVRALWMPYEDPAKAKVAEEAPDGFKIIEGSVVEKYAVVLELSNDPQSITVEAYDRIQSENKPVEAAFPEEGAAAWDDETVEMELLANTVDGVVPWEAEGQKDARGIDAQEDPLLLEGDVTLLATAELVGASGFNLAEDVSLISGGVETWSQDGRTSIGYEESFTQDGIYNVTALATTNRGQQVERSFRAFAIDKEAPLVELVAISGDENADYEAIDFSQGNSAVFGGGYAFALRVTDVSFDGQAAVYLNGSDEPVNMTWEKDERAGGNVPVYTALLPIGVEDGKYQVSASVTDGLGRETVLEEKTIVVALSSTIGIELEAGSEPVTYDGVSYFNESVCAVITASSFAFNYAEGAVPKAPEGQIAVSGLPRGASVEWSFSEEGGVPTWVGVVDDFGESAACKIEAGITIPGFENVTAATESFAVDATAPVLDVEFDVADASAGRDSYDRARAATITVTEANFSDDLITVTTAPDAVSAAAASTETVVEWNEVSAGVHVAVVEFAEDGRYQLAISGKDPVGNELVGGKGTIVNPSGYKSEKFTIDTVAPVLDVAFDAYKEAPEDEAFAYYNEQRVATVTLVEASMTADELNQMTNEIIAVEAQGGKAQIGSWATSEDNPAKHSLDITFAQDGIYKLSTLFIDGAGHIAVTGESGITLDGDGKYDSGQFAIDRTAPEVTFEVDQKAPGVMEGVHYFSGLTTEGKWLNIKVTATDENLVTSKEALDGIVSVEGNVRSQKQSWAVDFGGTSISTALLFDKYAEGKNSLSVKVSDKAGNVTEYTYGQDSASVSGTTFVQPESASGQLRKLSCGECSLAGEECAGHDFAMDIAAPTVEIGPEGDMPSSDYVSLLNDEKQMFFDENTVLEIKVEDKVGLKSVKLGEELKADHPYRILTDEITIEKGTTCTILVDLVDPYRLTEGIPLEIEDVAGNTRTWSIGKEGEVEDLSGSDSENTPLYAEQPQVHPEVVVQDLVAPELSFSGVKPGTYNSGQATATLNVSEFNFQYLTNLEDDAITVTKEAGNAGGPQTTSTVALGDLVAVDEDNGDYRYDFTTAEDGHYRLTAKVTDPVGHEGTASLGSFTVDNTAPIVRVTFDNNNSVNGNYYAAGRTATIVVEEHNFDASLINIETAGYVSGWRNSGDTHTATVSFHADGRYALSITGQDLAGNALAPYSCDEFIVDTTAPTIMFADVADGNAYAEEIAPVIMLEDEANLDFGSPEYTLVGMKNGQISYPVSESEGENSITIAYANFEVIGSVDDIYTLSASVRDMAGNVFTDEITFSVNRFGSNYRIVNEGDYAANNGYLLESQDVLIEEINVSGLESESMAVTMTRGIDVEALERTPSAQAAGYTIEGGTSQADETHGWSVYTYRIAAGNFDVDGRYHLAVSSQDMAGNINTSANYYDRGEDEAAAAELSFILDTTDPVITNLTVGDGNANVTRNRDGSFTVVENVGIDNVSITVGDKEVEPKADEFGNYTFRVPTSTLVSRDLTVVATDLAGRTAEANLNGLSSTGLLSIVVPAVVIVLVLAGVGAFAYLRFVRPKGVQPAQVAQMSGTYDDMWR